MEQNDTTKREKLPAYQQLVPVTRQVPRETIGAKWNPLPSNCVEQISQLVTDLQRPVVARVKDVRKTQVSTALQMVSRKLKRKLERGLPFPQGVRHVREDEFDFEKILDLNRSLEAQLTPTIHANRLLEAELSKESAILISEKDALAELEENAKSQALKRKQAGRKLHPLLQPNECATTKDDFDGHFSLGVQQCLPFAFSVSFSNKSNLINI
jgi:hypothetical protein